MDARREPTPALQGQYDATMSRDALISC